MYSFLIRVLEVIKVLMASVASVVFLGFAGVTLACSAVALAVSTPLFIIFSPILVPATIATTLLASGLGAGTTLGVTGMGLLMRLIKHPGGAPPAGSSQGKEEAASAPAAQPSFLSLLEMPNFIKSKLLERLIDLPGFGKKSGEQDESKGKKDKSKREGGKDRKDKGKKNGKSSKRKNKDKKKDKDSKDEDEDKDKNKGSKRKNKNKKKSRDSKDEDGDMKKGKGSKRKNKDKKKGRDSKDEDEDMKTGKGSKDKGKGIFGRILGKDSSDDESS